MSYSTSQAPAKFAPVLRSNLRVWPLIELFRQRRDLEKLSEHQLRDIGVSQSAARTEAKRPFWDAPKHWMK